MAEKVYNKNLKKENKFEFVLTINDHRVCGRFFSADDYNPKVRNSVDIRDMIDGIVRDIQSTLKKRDVEYMWGKYDLRENGYMKKWGEEMKSAKTFVENQNKPFEGE